MLLIDASDSVKVNRLELFAINGYFYGDPPDVCTTPIVFVLAETLCCQG
jgi:hypothetical protein